MNTILISSVVFSNYMAGSEMKHTGHLGFWTGLAAVVNWGSFILAILLPSVSFLAIFALQGVVGFVLYRTYLRYV